MNLTPQQIKDKLIFLKKGDKYKTYQVINNELEVIEVDVTEEFTPSQKDNINAYIDYLYNSSEAKKIFNQITEPISIAATALNFGGQKVPEPVMLLGIDILNGKKKIGFISKTGEYVEYDLRLAFMHELIHAATGLQDNPGEFNDPSKRNFSSPEASLGPTQVIANKIHAELGHPLRVSYDSAAFLHEPGENEDSSIERGTQFTKGKIVGSAKSEIDIGAFISDVTFILNGNSPNYINTSTNLPPTNDLFIHKQIPDADPPSNIVFQTGAGNDYLYGSDGNDQLIAGEDNDYLNGGKGNDTLRGDDFSGNRGIDTAEFSDEFENYDIETTGTTSKTTTITHKNNGIDGTDTLKDIEWGIFKGEEVNLENLNSNSANNSNSILLASSRIIPLPLEDGVETTEFIGAVHNIANPNPNDPPTPPHISLTAPVAMLDGDIDYTVNISPYELDTEYNVVYIIDTSSSIDPVELQTIQDAYTDLTNFYLSQDNAANINFGVISFDSQARFHLNSDGNQNLTGEEALSAIQSLTTDTGIGTRYLDGLNKADQFLLNSPYNRFSTTGNRLTHAL